MLKAANDANIQTGMLFENHIHLNCLWDKLNQVHEMWQERKYFFNSVDTIDEFCALILNGSYSDDFWDNLLWFIPNSKYYFSTMRRYEVTNKI